MGEGSRAVIRVGIIANPVSARDIRRIVSHAGNLSITDRANIVLRMLAGLSAAGVGDVVIMPELGGIRMHLMRALEREGRRPGAPRFPTVRYLEMPITGTATDSDTAARMMTAMNVAAIIVLGGDGTSRVVAAACGKTPIAGVSTGTNNSFPEFREPTITGLAVGLAAMRRVPVEYAFRFNKSLEVTVNDRREMALVDVAVVAESVTGAKAVWKTDGFRDLFVTFGAPDSIGLSSIVGLTSPLDRDAPEGRRARLTAPGDAAHTIAAPIAPGLIRDVGIAGVDAMLPDVGVTPTVATGAIALDGEREITFSRGDAVAVTLRLDAVLSVDVPACMAYAARQGLLSRGAVAAALG